MSHKPNKNRPPDNRDSGGCMEMASGAANRRSLSGEMLQQNLKCRTYNARTVQIVCGLLLLAVALVFGQTLGHEFVNCDDTEYVYENPQVAGGLTARGVVWAFTAGHADNWHPLTWISHMLDCQVYGLYAGGHHLTSVFLHAAAAILLFLTLWRMTGNLCASAFVAAVFAIHPLRAESVAWVAERKDVLSGLFFMLTLWAYIGYTRRPFSPVRYLAVAVLFAMGLMSKPMLVTLPFVLMLLDYWPLGRIGQPEAGKTFSLSDLFSRRVVIEKLPLLALTAASCVATFFAQSEAVVSIEAIPVSSRIANALVSYVAYMGDLVYPVGLAVFYPHPENSLPIWKVVASIPLLMGISLAALIWRRRFPYLFVGWFWYVGMMVPVIGVVQVGLHSMADRYTYLPHIGLCMAATWGVVQLTASWHYRHRVLGVASALAILVLMGFAWRQTSYWHDSETLWNHALACTARNYVAHNNLGISLAGRGQGDAALVHYQKALEIRPDYAETYFNLGVALERRGQVEAAIAHYQKALELKPDFEAAYNNLGIMLAGRGQVDTAIAHYQKALELKPGSAEAYNNLGNVLAGRGQADAAIANFHKALEIKPDFAEAHNNLGIMLAGRGQVDTAIAHYQRSLELKPGYAEAHYNFGSALAGRGQMEAAIAQYRKALELKPAYVEAHNNLGIALAGCGQAEAAIAQYRKALELKPDYAEGYNNIGNALAGRGQVEAAIAQYRKALEINPDFAKAHYNLGTALDQQGKIADAVIHWRKVVHLQPNNITFLRRLSWVLATCPVGSIRNGAEAVDLARRAVRLSDGREPVVLDTLAAAYAEAGRFSEAVEMVEQAVSLASAHGDLELADTIRARIKLYRAGSPYRETRPWASRVN